MLQVVSDNMKCSFTCAPPLNTHSGPSAAASHQTPPLCTCRAGFALLRPDSSPFAPLLPTSPHSHTHTAPCRRHTGFVPPYDSRSRMMDDSEVRAGALEAGYRIDQNTGMSVPLPQHSRAAEEEREQQFAMSSPVGGVYGRVGWVREQRLEWGLVLLVGHWACVLQDRVSYVVAAPPPCTRRAHMCMNVRLVSLYTLKPHTLKILADACSPCCTPRPSNRRWWRCWITA